MKSIRKIRGVVGTVIILLFLLGESQYLLRPSNTDQCTMAIEAFHNMPKNSFDVILYGSSHGWRGVNPMEMYEKYGIAAYNYGTNWQTLSTEALFFYDSLRTQSPKVVLIETYRINDVIKNQNLDGEIYFTKSISDFPYKRQYLKKAFNDNLERWVSYYFPLSQFHSSWNEVDINNFKEWWTVEEFENTMGYYSANVNFAGIETTEITKPNSSTFPQYDLCDDAIEILDGIVETCRKKNIELIFYTNPWQGQNNYSNAMSEYASENGCVYLDLFKLYEEVGFDEKIDFMDEGHLNRSGAIKAADYLGNFIEDSYDLPDVRKVDNNLWEGKFNNIVGRTHNDWIETHSDDK